MRNILIVMATALLAGCASPRYYGDGKYKDAGYEKPMLQDDRFNEYDSKRLIDDVLAKLSKCSSKPQVVMVARLDNQTSEMIDTISLQRELNDQLAQNGYTLIDKTSRPDLHDEYEYTKTGYVDPTKAPRTGKQEGVNILIRAALVSKVQENGNANEKTVRYKLTLQTVDSESALVKCSVVSEIVKEFERTRIAL